MFALAALLTLSACCRPAHAHNFTSDVLDRALSFALGERDPKWHHRITACANALGPARCINAFSIYRADSALDTYEKYGGCASDFGKDLRVFPWEKYANVTDEGMESELTSSAAKLLQVRKLKFSMFPGYRLELGIKDSGALNVDVFKNSDDNESENEVGRGMGKKLRKRFYAIVPFLLIPGLIMSAILPFVLPALKMMTIGAGMLNQMALTGAIFTLLRNNAFNDYYEKKIIYKNAGYRHKEHPPVHIEEEVHTHDVDDGFYQEGNHNVNSYNGGSDHFAAGANNVNSYNGGSDHFAAGANNFAAGSNNYEEVEVEEPTNSDWINQYYGGEGFGKVIGHSKRNTHTRYSNRRNPELKYRRM